MCVCIQRYERGQGFGSSSSSDETGTDSSDDSGTSENSSDSGVDQYESDPEHVQASHNVKNAHGFNTSELENDMCQFHMKQGRSPSQPRLSSKRKLSESSDSGS